MKTTVAKSDTKNYWGDVSGRNYLIDYRNITKGVKDYRWQDIGMTEEMDK